MDPELNRLNERYSSLQNSLSASSTAQPGNQMPTRRDVNTQQQMMKTSEAIRMSKDKALKENWYGPSKQETGETGVASKGLLTRTMDTLMAPLYGIVGAADYVSGQSRAGSLGKAINLNMNTDKRTMGDTIKPVIGGKTGRAVGFMADVVFDPVNWATMGTAALIPRLVAGAYKGGMKAGISGAAKGIGSAAESRLLEVALTARAITLGGTKAALNVGNAMNPMRYLSKTKTMVPVTKKSAEQTSQFTKFLEGRSEQAVKTYDEILGTSVVQRITAGTTIGSTWRRGLFDIVERVGEKTPSVKEYFNKYFNYSNAEWTRVALIKDALLKTAGVDMEVGVKAFVKSYESGADYATSLKIAEDELQGTMAAKMKQASDNPTTTEFGDGDAVLISKQEMSKVLSGLAAEGNVSAGDLVSFSRVVDDATDGASIGNNPKLFITNDPIENSFRLIEEANLASRGNMSGLVDDLKKIIERGDLGDTGIQWWDNIQKNMNTFKQVVKEANEAGGDASFKARVGAKVGEFMDVHSNLMAFFKRGAVGANPSAWTNSLFGNLIMAKMVGLDIMDPTYVANLKKAHQVISGKNGSELLLEELFQVEEMMPYLRNNPSLFEFSTGLKVTEVEGAARARALLGRFKQAGVDAGIISPDTDNLDIVTMMESVMRDSARAIGAADDSMQMVAEGYQKLKLDGLAKNPAARQRESINAEGKVVVQNATDITATEFFEAPGANRVFKKFADLAEEPGNYGAKIANFMFNQMPEAYSGIDYRAKLGSILYTSIDGVKAGELTVLARNVNLAPEDVVATVVKDGITRYKLSPAKAFEVANEAFLNYNAMPPIVKLLRQLPFISAPFASFTYGMYAKTLKTVMNNPALFNKVQFGMEEASGDETPIEKGLLAMERYEYLNDPAMMKLNFPGNNMVFMNMANMLPYYSLNMFQPPSRKYEGLLPNTVIQTLDRLPIMQNPIGSTLFDFLVLPSILGDELPQGKFGQPLFPRNASTLEKAGYLGRTLVDPFVPAIAQIPLGLATGLASPGITQYMPGYRWRQIAEAVQGNTSIGASSKEGAAQRTGRTLFGAGGIPIQAPVPFTYLDEEVIKN